jgi:hypothetical protein
MATLSSGARLGVYEIAGRLGAGGMGEVYRARDTTLRREVVLKVLPGDLAADPESSARLEREARLLASLNHPHIATLFGLEDRLTAAAVDVTGTTLRLDAPRRVLSTAYFTRDTRSFDVSPDGQRFLMIKDLEMQRDSGGRIVVVQGALDAQR